jgi:hypothetical protein
MNFDDFHKYSLIVLGIIVITLVIISNVFVLLLLIKQSIATTRAKFLGLFKRGQSSTSNLTPHSSVLSTEFQVSLEPTKATNAFLFSLCISGNCFSL